MAILSKACKPDNFELHNSLKLSFTNIQGLCSNYVNCESFLESNSPDMLQGCICQHFPRLARLWNSLPIEGFPLTYDLNGFKSRINRHLLTVVSF